ncbi:cell division protein FtsL [Mizugakiibacter sediminis]|uniref:Cell division protein FtsL n=1 Tax=Mizugakiibacter sediminis TaxID=1475481 RepID=A0A0K8QRZ2_9GAMM|nr:cell division protein FtsL [Mizugakiibacter sediminis]GAP67162.1 cell division protein FtsL [Mizugakiibacter sediminis]
MKLLAALAFAALLVADLVSAIGVVWARHESRVLFVELTRLQNTRDELNVDFGRLELEQATWADPGRIEQMARSQLGMVNPPPEDVELIQR